MPGIMSGFAGQLVNDASGRSPAVAALTRLALALVLASATAWAMLVLLGRTDAARRIGLASGAVAGAGVLGGVLLAHFWSRLGRLP
jgi:hypothetical protein